MDDDDFAFMQFLANDNNLYGFGDDLLECCIHIWHSGEGNHNEANLLSQLSGQQHLGKTIWSGCFCCRTSGEGGPTPPSVLQSGNTLRTLKLII